MPSRAAFERIHEYGGLRALLHHVAHLTGEANVALARVDARLDEHDVAADRRPREAGDDTDLGLALGDVADVARRPEELLELVFLVVATSVAPSATFTATPRQTAAIALEVTDAGLARVAVDDLLERCRRRSRAARCVMPCSPSCFGRRWFFAIASFSTAV